MKKSLISLLGPTSSGKTDIAVQLAKKYPNQLELVSVDSVQVYQGLDHGTNKPTLEQKKWLPHHLIDIVGLDENFNVAQFITQADQAISDILQRQRLPLLVGGSAYYYKHWLWGLPNIPESNQLKRDYWDQQEKEKGLAALYKQLEDKDPQRAYHIHPHDSYRVKRALELIEQGIVPSTRAIPKRKQPYPIYAYYLNPDRQELYQKINQRVEQMFDQGLYEEWEQWKDFSYPILNKIIGYKELYNYESREQAMEKIAKNTRAYAKRQICFFKRLPLKPLNPHEALDQFSQIIEDIFSA